MVAGQSSHSAANAHRSSLGSAEGVGLSRTLLSTLNHSCGGVPGTCSPALTWSVLVNNQRGSQGWGRRLRWGMTVVRSNRPCHPRVMVEVWEAVGQRTTYPHRVRVSAGVPMVRVKWRTAAPSSHLADCTVVVVLGRQYQGSTVARRGLGPAWAGYPRIHQYGRTRRRTRGLNDFESVGSVGPDARRAIVAGRC